MFKYAENNCLVCALYAILETCIKCKLYNKVIVMNMNNMNSQVNDIYIYDPMYILLRDRFVKFG